MSNQLPESASIPVGLVVEDVKLPLCVLTTATAARTGAGRWRPGKANQVGTSRAQSTRTGRWSFTRGWWRVKTSATATSWKRNGSRRSCGLPSFRSKGKLRTRQRVTQQQQRLKLRWKLWLRRLERLGTRFSTKRIAGGTSLTSGRLKARTTSMAMGGRGTESGIHRWMSSASTLRSSRTVLKWKPRSPRSTPAQRNNSRFPASRARCLSASSTRVATPGSLRRTAA
mgnify:CR=1 FL=1